MSETPCTPGPRNREDGTFDEEDVCTRCGVPEGFCWCPPLSLLDRRRRKDLARMVLLRERESK